MFTSLRNWSFARENASKMKHPVRFRAPICHVMCDSDAIPACRPIIHTACGRLEPGGMKTCHKRLRDPNSHSQESIRSQKSIRHAQMCHGPSCWRMTPVGGNSESPTASDGSSDGADDARWRSQRGPCEYVTNIGATPTDQPVHQQTNNRPTRPSTELNNPPNVQRRLWII